MQRHDASAFLHPALISTVGAAGPAVPSINTGEVAAGPAVAAVVAGPVDTVVVEPADRVAGIVVVAAASVQRTGGSALQHMCGQECP